MPEAYGLYVVMSDPVVGYERCTEAAVACGVRYAQLRMKSRPRTEVLDVAHRLRAITAGTATRFIVNDDLDIAMAVDADGVHLGQRDTPLADARARWTAPGKCFGLSTHNEEQQDEALRLRPDYIGIGPVFPTPAKAVPDPDLGEARLADMVRHTAPLTHVAIGGITEANLPALLARGVVNFCAVRPIMAAADPASVMCRLQTNWTQARDRVPHG